jgi:hypothetical protein
MTLISYIPFAFPVEFLKTKVSHTILYIWQTCSDHNACAIILSQNYSSHTEKCAFLHGRTSKQSSELFLSTLLSCAAELFQ